MPHNQPNNQNNEPSEAELEAMIRAEEERLRILEKEKALMFSNLVKAADPSQSNKTGFFSKFFKKTR